MAKVRKAKKIIGVRPLYPLDLASDFFEVGIEMMRNNIRKRSPKMSASRIEKELVTWLTRVADTDTLRTDSRFQEREI